MGKLVMGYWDCPFCGSKEIRGDVVNCPSCGRARGDVKFYMKGYTEGEIRQENQRGDIEYLTEEQSKYVSRNPDWYCSFCNSLNSDNAQFCGNCGATRADSEANYFDMLKKNREKEEAELAAQPQPSSSGSKKKPRLLLALIPVLIIALVLLLWPKNHTGTVTGFSWSRQIATEDYKEVTEEDWSVPSGGTIVSQQQKVHHYDSVLSGYRNVTRTRQVIDHYETEYTYEDRGNGTFEEVPHQRAVYTTEEYTEKEPVYEQVPRYQTAYTYRIWRWVAGETLRSSGLDHNPVWPEMESGEYRRERENGRSGEYRFTILNEKGEAVTYQLAEYSWEKNESVWLAIDENNPVKIKTSGFSTVLQDKDGKNLATLKQVR